MFEAFLEPGRQDFACRAEGCRPTLPLDIVAIIVSYLSSPADLAAMSRVSRIHHFITLQHLYRVVTLTASPSPPPPSTTAVPRRHTSLLAALATLQKPATAACVQKLVLRGSVGTPQHAREHWKAGVWSDYEGTIALAIAGALSGMPALKEFVWAITDTYPHPFLYVALSRHSSLETVEIRFPAAMPEFPHRPPLTTLPRFPHLRHLKLIDISAPPAMDDVSLPLVASPKLYAVTCSWPLGSEILAGQREFRRCVKARVGVAPRIKMKEVMLRNVVSGEDEEGGFDGFFVTEEIERLELIDCDLAPETWRSMFMRSPPRPSPEHGSKTHRQQGYNHRQSSLSTHSPSSAASSPNSTRTELVESTSQPLALRTFRTNTLSAHHISLLNCCSQLQNLYICDQADNEASAAVRDMKPAALAAITRSGSTLRRLRLSPSWLMAKADVSLLIRVCPDLEELAIAMDHSEWEALHLLIPFLRNIRAVALLESPWAHGVAPWWWQEDEWRQFVNRKKTVGAPALGARTARGSRKRNFREFHESMLDDADGYLEPFVVGLAHESWGKQYEMEESMAEEGFTGVRWLSFGGVYWRAGKVVQIRPEDGKPVRRCTRIEFEEAAESVGVLGCMRGL